jgi:hypothetical protein
MHVIIDNTAVCAMHTDSKSVTLGNFLAEGTLSDFAEEDGDE